MKETGQRINQQIVGNAGLYYCCYQLSLLGWNVMPTARNARGIDIVAYNAEGNYVGIQVKSLSKRNPVPLGADLKKIMGHFWIIINDLKSGKPKAFILKPREVAKMAHRGEKDGKVSYWLQPNSYDTTAFKDKWDIIK